MGRRAATATAVEAVAGKWKCAAMAATASIWIQCVSGSAYCFGIYSPLLKSTQGYDQSILDTVAFFKDLGANTGVTAGAIYSSSPVDGRPRLVLATGAALCFAGYFLMWLSVARIISRPPVALMCLFMFLAAHAQTFFNTADVVTAVRNFPGHRGTAVGIMKGFLGLSGAILIQVYHTAYRREPSYFLLMLSLLPTILVILVMYFVRVYPTDHQDDMPLLNSFSLIALITAGYLMVVMILENVLTLGSTVRILTIVLLLVLLASPLCLVIRRHSRDSRLPVDATSDETLMLIDEGSSYEIVEAELEQNHLIQTNRDISMPETVGNSNLFQSMMTCNFWLLFIAVACGMGSGLATINNISQICASLGCKSRESNTLVSLWSIWNFLGRFGIGYMSDYFLHSKGCARPLFMAVMLASMGIGHVLIASGLPSVIYVGSIVIGVCYGSQWSLMPTISSEIFGLTHFGTIFNTITIAGPLGSYIVSVRVVGYIYDLESHHKTCVGRHCFLVSFLIMTAVCVFGSVISLTLSFRTRRFYKQVVCSKLQNVVLS
ncbi:hypothetical protein AXF42_Ash014262 [Apostasia shenzhenica]|uniref:Uncharacterized protein n=1 Tax=Apostasia shenzhenica TaxID=1088818 RepID=A0A2I0A1D5_9ASPA|nr:hypothetical protein AXF42_Ash014262 [Apostasia shenzhenica]